MNLAQNDNSVPIPDQPVTSSCELTGMVSVFVQCLMFALVVSGIIMKRSWEKPKRKWSIFLLDMFKQGQSMMLIHFINLFFSLIYGKKTNSDQCVWYFTSIMIDSTIGIFFQWL